jgi:hypothetical protein
VTRPRPIAAVLGLLAVVAACALAACGSSASDQSAQSLLRKTFSTSKGVKSGRLNVSLNANLQGVQSLSGPVALRLSGPFESQGAKTLPRFDFTIGLTSSGQSFSAGAVSTGSKGYVRFQGKPYVLSEALFQQFKKGYEQSAAKSAKKKSTNTFASLGIDPSRWVTSARKAGEQDVGGAQTVHITSGVDVPRFLADVSTLLGKAGSVSQGTQVPQSLTAKQRQAIEKAVKTATVDVFTGKDDNVLRRLDLNVALRKTATSGAGTVRFTLEIDDLNASQDIKAPAGAQPLANLLSQLRAGTASGTGTGTGTGTATTPAPATTAPSGGATPKYLACINKAGQDLKKVQACAQYL